MEEIGRRLRAAREGKGITLEQAEEDTKIRQKYLRALEAGREADIPGEVYLKGFLRSYGNYLGLDGPALVDEYKRLKLQARMKEMAGQEAQPAAEEAPSRESRTSTPEGRPGDGKPEAREAAAQAVPRSQEDRVVRAAGERPARQPGQPAARPAAEKSAARLQAAERSPSQHPPLTRTRGRGSRNRAMRRTLTILVACLLLGGVAWAIYYQLSGSPSGTPQNPAQQGDIQANPPDGSGAASGQSETAGSTESGAVTWRIGEDKHAYFTVKAPKAEVRLEFGVDAVWLSAEGDGQLLFDGTLPEGNKDPLFFSGQQITIHMGFMDGISLTVNGEHFEKPLTDGPWFLVFEAVGD